MWSFVSDEKDSWRYFVNQSGWKFSWMHPRYASDCMFMYVYHDKIMKGEFTDNGDICCKLYSSSKHKAQFDRLQNETCTEIIGGDWNDWEMDILSQDKLVFSRAGTRRLAFVHDCTYLFGVLALETLARVLYSAPDPLSVAGEQGSRLRARRRHVQTRHQAGARGSRTSRDRQQ